MNDAIDQLPDIPVKRALLSVSDKTGIVELAQKLQASDIEILSTGGTAAKLRDAGIPVTDVSEITKFPECLDGRVKTLHPMIHGGILARPGIKEHAAALTELNIRPIQLVVVNLYPFQRAVEDKPDDLEHAVENIDIGGPAMVRAAAKNFENVCILTNPGQYEPFIAQLEQTSGKTSGSFRASLAAEAFRLTADYDASIFKKLSHNAGDTHALSIQEPMHQPLRYGENPHQPAGVYGNPEQYITCFHGKELSYNNYLDIDASLQLGADFQDTNDALCAIFKHTLPCGVALAKESREAWEKAFSTDTVSPFGGIVLFNHKLDLQTAKAVDTIFTEIILAPDFEDEALELLQKKSNRRLVRIKKWPGQEQPVIRSISGGFLKQVPDTGFESEKREIVTAKHPDEKERETLEFAWKIAKHVKSNAIVYASDRQTIGIGTGQPNRVDSSRFAVQKAKEFGHSLAGSVIASDAFFPFADGIDEAGRAGASAIIQPGGSIRDNEVIEKADQLGMSMVLTGTRHFRH